MLNPLLLKVCCQTQSLQVLSGPSVIKNYIISTALNGLGEQKNSEQTPRGWHVIRAKIGGHCESNAVFIGRRHTGEYYSYDLRKKFPDRDWILTRILWLSGLEVGKNRLGNVDTMQRYIYIHGTPDDVNLGIPGSRGCIRMNNQDIIQLFDFVQVGTKLLITE